MELGGEGLEDAPVFGVEVVGAVADVFDEAEGDVAVGDENIASGRVGEDGRVECIFVEVAEGFGEGEFDGGEGVGSEASPHGKGMCGNEVAAFDFGDINSGADYAEGFLKDGKEVNPGFGE